MVKLTADIVIIGGGLTGAALMLALKGHGYDVLLLDAKPLNNPVLPSMFDARTLALAPASVNILQQLALWPLLADASNPIDSIHVSQQGRFGVTRLQKKSVEPLGYVVELQTISAALQRRLPLDKVLAPAELVDLDVATQTARVQYAGREHHIKAQLFVAADGGQSTMRRWSTLEVKTKSYQQQALVANIGLSRSHQNIAYERFTQQGPLAMLPMTEQRVAMVWCLPAHEAKRLQLLEESLFLKQLQQVFGYRLGRLTKVGKRALFPLQEVVMPVQTEWPLVFVGNAAHTLHPVAGQGFNLGLRDVAVLAQCIVQYGLNAAMLTRYQALRESDQTAIIAFTDTLVRLFGSRVPGVGLGRSLGLLALDNVNLLQQVLMRYARGYGGDVPDLVCGIPLIQETSK